MDLLILGGASYDSIIYLDEFPTPAPQTIHKSIFVETVGSTGTGKAANCCYLGFNTTLHVLLGDDICGERIMDFLRSKPICVLHDIDPVGTERHVNIMNKHGQRISIFVNPSSDEPPIRYMAMEPEIKKADTVVLNIVNYCRNYIPLLKKHKKEVWTDLHDYDGVSSYHQDFINAADYIFMSSDNLPDYRKTMQEIMNKGKRLVVCTHGKAGATALTLEGQWLDTPSIDCYQLVDSNGAGDAFFSGFLYAHKQGHNIADCLQYGHILGGMCIASARIAADDLSIAKVEKEFVSIFK
jgi:sugar/nucleoside kinase (ribokinase family)